MESKTCWLHFLFLSELAEFGFDDEATEGKYPDTASE